MHPTFRKIVASAGGLVTVVLAIAWAFYSVNDASRILRHETGLASVFNRGDALYKKFGDIYTMLSVFGLAIAAGLAFTLLTWERRPRRWRIELTFWVLLLLALPMSLINFWSGDVFVSRSQQVFLNVIQVILVGVCSLQLSRTVTATDTEVVLKALATLFLLGCGLFVPLLFTALWVAVALGLLSVKASEELSSGWISAASGVAALGLSVQQYRLEKSKQAAGSSSSSSRIVLP